MNKAKNYTLLVISCESNADEVADNHTVSDFKNRKLMAKQGLLGKKFYTIELVHPLSSEEINSLTLSESEAK